MEGEGSTRSDEINQNQETLNLLVTSKPFVLDKQNKLDILYTNADCFTNKKDDLQLLLNTLDFKPNVIIITEVNPKKTIKGLQECEFIIKGYNLYSVNIGVENSRGVIVYVDVNYCSVEIDIDDNIKYSESIFVRIRDSNSNLLTIGAFYRSPCSSKENNLQMLNRINYVCKNISGNLLLLGDFNFGNINWETWTTSCGLNSPECKFLNCLRNNLLNQHILFPTRARGTNAPHTLDLIISNANFVFDVENLSPLGKSDHSVIHCVCELELDGLPNVSKYIYNKGNYEELRKSTEFILNLKKS